MANIIIYKKLKKHAAIFGKNFILHNNVRFKPGWGFGLDKRINGFYVITLPVFLEGMDFNQHINSFLRKIINGRIKALVGVGMELAVIIYQIKQHERIQQRKKIRENQQQRLLMGNAV